MKTRASLHKDKAGKAAAQAQSTQMSAPEKQK
jgi:hypothetical protein